MGALELSGLNSLCNTFSVAASLPAIDKDAAVSPLMYTKFLKVEKSCLVGNKLGNTNLSELYKD